MPRQATPLYLVYGGEALDDLLYRAVSDCPPTLDDFLSYEALGRSYNGRRYFRGIGVSFFRTRASAENAVAHLRRATAVAACDLRQPGVVWAKTGGLEHVTVWAPPDVLLASVVECVGDER